MHTHNQLMKNKISIVFLLLLLLSITSFAQKEKMTREEKDEKNQARTTRINNKNDYVVFHRQILGLKQYQDERKKIPVLQKANKGAAIKVLAIVDSLDDEEDGKSKNLQGFIRLDVGDNSTNMYEVIFDRTTKKIISVNRTQEAIEADKEAASDKQENITTGKPKEKAVIHKKNKDDDDDEESDEDAPAKSKSKKIKDKENDAE